MNARLLAHIGNRHCNHAYYSRARNRHTYVAGHTASHRIHADEKRKAAMEAAAKQDREARASAAVAKLERLKAGWKENQVLQAAAAAGDSSAVGKKKVCLGTIEAQTANAADTWAGW
jgi:hypothetical protein